MKPVLAVVGWLLLAVFAHARSGQDDDAALKQDLMQLARKRIEAFDLGDPRVWSPYVSDDYFIATPTGKVVAKAEVMAGFGPPTAGYRDVFRFEDVHVVREGDVAVMSYRIKEHEWWGTQDNDVPDLRKTDTYVLKGGRWLLLASHETFYPVARTPVDGDPKAYRRYVGRYEVMPSLVYTVSTEDNKLYIRENDGPSKVELLPLSATTFFSLPDSGFFNEGGVGVVVFVADGKGSVKRISFRRYGAEVNARKIS